MSMLTGAVFIAMAWLDPLGPLAIIMGSGCCAVALESRLDLDDWPRPAVAQSLTTIETEQSGQAAA
jgi:hypothetical protein